jgi:DNA-directed RNA polymerase specialized sigma24 family protein
VDEVTPERRTSLRQRLIRVTQAINRLPPHCCEVLWLRRVEHLSGKETASRRAESVSRPWNRVENGRFLRAKIDGTLESLSVGTSR